jgi:hypothetical protein
MPIDVQVSAVTALIVSEPKERQVYEGRGDDKKAKGRATDPEGRPVSAVTAVVLCEPLGLLGDVTVLLPEPTGQEPRAGGDRASRRFDGGEAGWRRLRGDPDHDHR